MTKAVMCDRCGSVVVPVRDAMSVALHELRKDGMPIVPAGTEGHLCKECATGFRKWYYGPKNAAKDEGLV